MKSLRPVNLYFATATAARKAAAMAMRTATQTTMIVLTTSFQKNGICIASRKC